LTSRAERPPVRNETRHSGFRPPRIGKFDFQIIVSQDHFSPLRV
jgi:hypothetical protein